MDAQQILVVDDDPGFRKLLETILKGEGYQVTAASGKQVALHLCDRKQYDLVITDLRLPDGDGIEILRWLREHAPQTPVILITGYGTVTSAVEAMKLGAFDFLGKPLGNPDELRLLARKVFESVTSQHESALFREDQSARFNCGHIIAEDHRMRKVLDLARKVAPTNAAVLLTGESGTGKELVARCIHNHSLRTARVFVAVNCAALSPTLIESELFGHEKGAFTGAVAQHVGRFERAHGGTLFLDEIGELDGNLQAKLLRVLQERRFERVGGTREIAADARVIAATNRNLKRQVEDGKFREDLYYRLNMFPIEIPPLRDRGEDALRLARFFLERAARSLGKRPLRIAPEAEDVLRRYDWPGNVRELENLMERMAILSEDAIEAADLPLAAAAERPVQLRDIERQVILDALAANAGNRTRTAAQLGISVRTLQYRLKEYGLAGAADQADA
ncbi:MAG: sigma-54-dependent Fis family transcriptional regulator [Bryobacteraceae bacterium]|nr:sigma-54-dependent Fis family transcriptional regulator [Bryobacteraceae bacterium]